MFCFSAPLSSWVVPLSSMWTGKVAVVEFFFCLQIYVQPHDCWSSSILLLTFFSKFLYWWNREFIIYLYIKPGGIWDLSFSQDPQCVKWCISLSILFLPFFMSHRITLQDTNHAPELDQLFCMSFLLPVNKAGLFRAIPLAPGFWFIVQIQIAATGEALLDGKMSTTIQSIPEGRKIGHCIAVVLFP